MQVKRTFGASILLTLAAAFCAQAGPLQVDQVPKDAQWLIHVDVDAARSSQVVEAFWKQCRGESMDQGPIKWLREQWDSNPTKELHGLTLYGMKIGSRRPVAVVHAKLDKQKIVEKFKQLSKLRMNCALLGPATRTRQWFGIGTLSPRGCRKTFQNGLPRWRSSSPGPRSNHNDAPSPIRSRRTTA